MRRERRLRAVPGALIILAHLVFFAVLLRYAGMPTVRNDTAPADYIAYVHIPAAARPAPAQAPAPAPQRAARKRSASLRQDAPLPAPPPAAPSVQEAHEAQSARAAPQGARLDMAALRSDARRIAGEYVPEPFERVRDAEHRLEAGKKDLGRAIREAKRPPCTKKYSGGTSLNVFALIPLAIDTITDTGCKW